MSQYPIPADLQDWYKSCYAEQSEPAVCVGLDVVRLIERIARLEAQRKALVDALEMARRYVVSHSPAALVADVRQIDAALKSQEDK